VTSPPVTRLGSGFWNNGSTRTDPVKKSGDPFVDGRDPFRAIAIWPVLVFACGCAEPDAPAATSAAHAAEAAMISRRVMIRSPVFRSAARPGGFSGRNHL
jgi:hypothetical protein